MLTQIFKSGYGSGLTTCAAFLTDRMI